MTARQRLVISLIMAVAVTHGDSLQQRPKRSGGIVFPGIRFQPQPPANGPDDAALELPEDMDLNGMDHDSLSRINSIDNITAFADLFGIPLPPPEDEITTRYGGASETATMATCKPEIRTVELDLPVEANTLFYPTCVRLEQCGGCCYGPLLTCRPTVTTPVVLKVLKTVASSGSRTSRRRLQRSRRRRDTVPSYYDVEVLKHEECACGCKVQEQDCNPNIHTYYEGECACVCKNKNEKAKCERQSDTKYWDNDSCTCYCRRPVPCSTGQSFSPVSCKCE